MDTLNFTPAELIPLEKQETNQQADPMSDPIVRKTMEMLEKKAAIIRGSIRRALNKKPVCGGILALAMGISEASLYDTSDKLKAKYGEPIEVTERQFVSKRIYKTGDYIVEAWIANERSRYGLYDGQVVWQITKRADGKAMSSSEIEAFLNRSDHKEKWTFQGNGTWKMGNYAIARYDSFRKNLLEQLSH
jgi:hypothetical protein